MVRHNKIPIRPSLGGTDAVGIIIARVPVLALIVILIIDVRIVAHGHMELALVARKAVVVKDTMGLVTIHITSDSHHLW